jgi:hypothetical protein
VQVPARAVSEKGSQYPMTTRYTHGGRSRWDLDSDRSAAGATQATVAMTKRLRAAGKGKSARGEESSLGSQSVVLGSGPGLVLGSGLGSWSVVPRSWPVVPGSWPVVLGSWPMVLGSGLVLGSAGRDRERSSSTENYKPLLQGPPRPPPPPPPPHPKA